MISQIEPVGHPERNLARSAAVLGDQPYFGLGGEPELTYPLCRRVGVCDS